MKYLPNLGTACSILGMSSLTKLILALLILSPLSALGDIKDIRDYEHPLVLKPFIITDDGAIVTADRSHWVWLHWENFLAIGMDKLLFKIDGVIYTSPMEGYKVDQLDEPQEDVPE